MTTRAELDQLAVIVTTLLPPRHRPLDEVPIQPDTHYIQGAYGRVRLVRDGGAVEVSPSLTKSELELWVRAFIEGISAGRRT